MGLLLANATTAQLSRWTDLPLPNGVVPSQLDGQGKLVTYRENNVLRAYSAFTRRWHTLAIGPNATIRLHNDCLLVQDGTQWTAFSAWTGQAAQLTVSAMAQYRNPGGHQNDSILLVTDGNSVHAFSCFEGNWVTRQVAAAYDVAVQRHVAVLTSGSLLGGFDAYTGTWHDITVTTAPTYLSCDGSAGLAIETNTVHGFSALHRSWQSASIPPGAALSRADDLALFYDATQMVGYSAVQGRFEVSPIGTTTAPRIADLLTIAETPLGLVAFSAPRGVFSAPLGPNTARVTLGTATAIIADGSQVTGYSAIHDTAAMIAVPSVTESATNVVASAIETTNTPPWCFSALTGSWYQAPNDAVPGPPSLTMTSALLSATSGAYAFSARSGNFVPLSTTAPVLIGNSQSAVGLAWDNASLHAFDARSDTWRSVTRTSSAQPIVQIWRVNMQIIDGPTVHGFGAYCGTWSSQTLSEAFSFGQANSESSRVATATHLLAHSPLPSLLAYSQFPEFRRPQPTGSTARFALHLPGGGTGIVAGGNLASAPTPIAGLGDLWLQQPMATLLIHALPAQEHALFDLTIPFVRSLVGTQWAFQALSIPQSQGPGLTEATSLYLL